jgi:membrane fusion protein, multidrug efflux system
MAGAAWDCVMKRVLYLVILLAAGAVVYIYAYPGLAGAGSAHAQQTAGGAPGSGRPVGGQSPQGQLSGSRPGGGFPSGVVTAAAQRQTVPITKSAVGFVEPANMVVVRPRADGTVVSVGVAEGQTVKAGDLLFKLDDRALQATIARDQAQIAKDQANASSAQAALTREQDLVTKGVDPQSALDVAVAAAKAAQATVAVDQAQLQGDQVQLSYMTITAPIAGRVGTVNTSPGNVVHASDTSAGGLATITEMSRLRVSFSIAEGDLDKFRGAMAQGKPLPVEIRAPEDTRPRAGGTLSFIDSSVDTASGTVVLKADVDNRAGSLWPGQYVTATTQLGAYPDATTIPLVAIQQSDAGPYVFVVGADAKVRKRQVTVIASIGDTVVTGPEVKPGDHVVVEGQLRLADGAPVRETLQGQAGGVATGAGSQPGRRQGNAGGTGGAAGSAAGGTTDAAAGKPPAANS